MSIIIKNKNFYFVTLNDTLNSIAYKLNVNPTKILIDNKISPKDIKPGTILYISE